MKPQTVRIAIPEEFRQLCDESGVAPETVLKGLIADLCGLESQDDAQLNNHGSDEREAARTWFRRVMWGGRLQNQ